MLVVFDEDFAPFLLLSAHLTVHCLAKGPDKRIFSAFGREMRLTATACRKFKVVVIASGAAVGASVVYGLVSGRALPQFLALKRVVTSRDSQRILIDDRIKAVVVLSVLRANVQIVVLGPLVVIDLTEEVPLIDQGQFLVLGKQLVILLQSSVVLGSYLGSQAVRIRWKFVGYALLGILDARPLPIVLLGLSKVDLR